MFLLHNAVLMIIRAAAHRGVSRHCFIFMRLLLALAILTSCTTINIPYSKLPQNYILTVHQNAAVEESLSVAVAGNTNVLISDGRHSVLIDGFFTRRKILTALFALQPDTDQIKKSLNAYRIAWSEEPHSPSAKLDALIVTHAHFDHAMDAPVVGALTDAAVIGSPSVKFILQGYNRKSMNHKIDMNRFVNVSNASEFSWQNDRFSIRLFKSTHGGGRQFISRSIGSMINGPIKTELCPPASLLCYKQGDVYAVWIEHRPSGHAFLIQATSGMAALPDDLRADMTFLSLGQAAEMLPSEWEAYYDTFVKQPRAQVVIPIHWEDFMASSISSKPRSNLADDLEKSVRQLEMSVKNKQAQLFWLKPNERLLIQHEQNQ